jgi:hypothetical protein
VGAAVIRIPSTVKADVTRTRLYYTATIALFLFVCYFLVHFSIFSLFLFLLYIDLRSMVLHLKCDGINVSIIIKPDPFWPFPSFQPEEVDQVSSKQNKNRNKAFPQSISIHQLMGRIVFLSSGVCRDIQVRHFTCYRSPCHHHHSAGRWRRPRLASSR